MKSADTQGLKPIFTTIVDVVAKATTHKDHTNENAYSFSVQASGAASSKRVYALRKTK